jgi:hypothetical protein
MNFASLRWLGLAPHLSAYRDAGSVETELDQAAAWAIDALRAKFGDGVIVPGRLM